MTDLHELRERVRAAEGPDREIDREIGMLIGGWELKTVEGAERYGLMLHVPDDGIYVDAADGLYPALTDSIDSALALVERVLPGKIIRLCSPRIGDDLTWWCDLAMTTGTGKSPPIAILDALLTALIEQAEKQDAAE